MRLSTKGRYGARALVDIATHQNAGPVNLREISERQGISNRYLGQLMRRLASRRLVTSVRGRGGGFVLSRAASRISLAEIVEAMEGHMNVVECVSNSDFCARASFCPTRPVWKGVADAIYEYLAGITLQELCEKERRRYVENG